MLWVARDICFLTFQVTITTLRIFVDDIWAYVFPSDYLPAISIKGIKDKKVLSNYLGKEVVKFVATKETQPGVVIGDDAIGTDRAWLTVTFADGSTQDIFVKVPTSTFFLRVLLTFTGLYKNEILFYDNTYNLIVGNLNMPKLHCCRWKGTRFVLIMEDLVKSDCVLMNLFETCSKEQCHMMLRTLAELHSVYWMRGYNAWSESRRPPLIRLLVQATSYEVLRKYPGMFSKDVHALYIQFISNYDKVRAFWARDPQTFVHGDTHNGNVCLRPNGIAGLYDFQVVGVESPFRDVGYFMQMSCDPALLEAHEKDLVRFYLDELNNHLAAKNVPQSQRLTFEQGWYCYRSQSLYSLLACMVTFGAGNFVQSETSAKALADRVVKALARLGTAQVLREILDKATPFDKNPGTNKNK